MSCQRGSKTQWEQLPGAEFLKFPSRSAVTGLEALGASHRLALVIIPYKVPCVQGLQIPTQKPHRSQSQSALMREAADNSGNHHYRDEQQENLL